jgi:hypothetical protein
MQEPFRCLACGAPSVSATACSSCGGRSFTLARPPGSPAAVRAHEGRLAELVPIDQAPSRRRARFVRHGT